MSRTKMSNILKCRVLKCRVYQNVEAQVTLGNALTDGDGQCYHQNVTTYENVEVCIITLTLTGNIAVQMEQNFLIGVKPTSNQE